MSTSYEAVGARRGRPEHRNYHAVGRGAKKAVCGWRVPVVGYAATGPVVTCKECVELLRLGAEEEARDKAVAQEIEVIEVKVTPPVTKATPAGMLASLDLLMEAADQVYERWLEYGPVDDGRPKGQKFEEGLIWLGGVANYLRNLHKKEPAPGGEPGAGGVTRGAG